MLRSPGLLSILALSSCTFGCHRRERQATPSHAPAPADEAAPAAEAAPDDDKHFREAAMWLDGVPLAIIKYNELPPTLRAQKPEDPNDPYSHFSLVDYFEALGIDVAKVKETHWYGASGRVAVVSGDELRRWRGKLFFNFTREFRGKPRLEWPAGLNSTGAIDLVDNITVYVDKAPPAAATLKPEVIPFATTRLKGGARIYVDGRLVSILKRRTLEETSVPPLDDGDDNDPRYPLFAWLATLGIKTAQIHALDLVNKEEYVTRLSAADVAAQKNSLALSAPQHSHGGGLVSLTQNGARVDAPVAAILLYTRPTPPERVIHTAWLGSMDGQRSRLPQGGARDSAALR